MNTDARLHVTPAKGMVTRDLVQTPKIRLREVVQEAQIGGRDTAGWIELRRATSKVVNGRAGPAHG